MLDVLREVSKGSARNAKLQQRFYKQLLTLDEELAQIVKKATQFQKDRPVHPSITANLQELEATYNKLDIECGERDESDEDE